MNVSFVVAPYEADSQLAFMFNEGIIDFVITEDSDLLVFGVTKVFFKIDPKGDGFHIDIDNIGNCEAFKLPQKRGLAQ
jgi:5'-3' exonuclease